MPWVLRIIAMITAILLIAGCASSQNGFQRVDAGGWSIQERALVFGYIDMGDAPTSLDWVTYEQVDPPTDKPFYEFFVKNGAFYHPNASPGAFRMNAFGGYNSFRRTRYTFEVPRQGGVETRARIQEPGVHFIGAFRYEKVRTGLFEQDQYALEAVDRPSEKELLERLLTDAKGTSWEARIRARLDHL